AARNQPETTAITQPSNSPATKKMSNHQDMCLAGTDQNSKSRGTSVSLAKANRKHHASTMTITRTNITRLNDWIMIAFRKSCQDCQHNRWETAGQANRWS